jgi:hypothetical protein
MSVDPDAVQFKNTLQNMMDVLQSFNSSKTVNAEEPIVAEIGDMVSAVINPGTDEEAIIEGELVGILDEDEEDSKQTVLIRTKNTRVSQVKLPKTVKVQNVRTPNKFTVKTRKSGK